MSVEQPDVRDLPDKLLGQIIHNLRSFPNETVDFSKPHLRRSLQHVFPLFLILYSALVVLGSIGNAVMIAHILRRRLYRDPTNAYMMNIGVCNFIMSVLLLPLSLAILLIQNWIFGSFLCYIVPMLQDVPIHATMVTMVFVSMDRYRLILYPHKARIPPFIAVLAVWVISVCVVLPYAVYMNYIDLQGLFGKQFEGVGICTVNLGDDIDEYIRGLFIALYALPLALVTFLHVRISGELKCREAPVSLAMLDSTSRGSQQDVWSLHDNSRPSSSAILTEMDGRDGFLYHDAHQLPSFLTPAPMGIGGGNGGSHTPTLLGGRTPSLHQLEEAEVDVVREKRNQRYIATIVTCFALCLCPLMILRLVKNMVLETYDNSGHFDITFITFVWVAFLPTITTPALYAAWRLTRTTKERLCSYLQFGFRGRRSAHAQNFTPMFYSCHARAAHRLSLEPALAPSSPHAHHTPHHGGHTSRSDNLRPYSLALPS
ncbi:orexin receptor type 1-like [Homarus americanus]|uniref:orexin receptor type 1-like n=1 Tax=Homarus americanus TaxID=6706 RepID=UPI001C45F2C8|nr:orexin receptor type 1-like [Homarus americanus]